MALNGDTANKIGTYSLAINAKAHGIPFFVVTPIASVNVRLADGRGIRVEERPAQELTHWNGQWRQHSKNGNFQAFPIAPLSALCGTRHLTLPRANLSPAF